MVLEPRSLTGVRGAFAPFLGMALYLGWGVVAWRGFDALRREIGSRVAAR